MNNEPKDYTFTRIVILSIFAEIIVFLLRVFNVFTFSWWYTLIPIGIMYLLILTYLPIKLYIKDKLEEKKNKTKND
jgi:ABC-type bacteriocin/lantibiotic exporter with double-glycine peptidase domain